MDDVPSGWSKIEAAWKGRAGAPTLVVLEDQAEKAGLLRRNTCGVCHDGPDHLRRLREGAERLARSDPQFGAEYTAALEWLTQQHAR